MPDRSEQRNAPRTTDPANWRRDTSVYPPEPCVTRGCNRLRQVLGYCTTCAAPALVNRGVLARRTRRLLTLLATNHDVGELWCDDVNDAIADCWDALEGSTDESEPAPDFPTAPDNESALA